GLDVQSYTPLQVKMGITGYGRAEKKQIQIMVQKILNLSEIPKPDDAADAIAVAITHINSLTNSLYSTNSISNTSLEKGLKKDKISAKEFRELYLKK
ncbi:MAG: crossover junction endodeoxyribonuclease RuvC, partial [Cetobacterium sp.]